MALDYTSEIFHPSHSGHNTCISMYKIDLPFHKSVHGLKTLSYLGPKTWNRLPSQIDVVFLDMSFWVFFDCNSFILVANKYFLTYTEAGTKLTPQ